MQPSKRTRMSITQQNHAPRFIVDKLLSNFFVDLPTQDGKDSVVKRGTPLVHVHQHSVEASTIEGEELEQLKTIMPPMIGECQLTRNPVELEDSERTDSLTGLYVSLAASNTSVASIDHPPPQSSISVKKDKGVLTRSPRSPDISERHVVSTSSDHRSPTINKPSLSVENYTGAMTRNKSYEAKQLAWALAESKKEYKRSQLRSIHGSTSRVIPPGGTSSGAAASDKDNDTVEPSKGDSMDGNEGDVRDAMMILYKGKPKENSKKKDDDDDDLGGSKPIKMRYMHSIIKDC